jgi:hypothetical protein
MFSVWLPPRRTAAKGRIVFHTDREEIMHVWWAWDDLDQRYGGSSASARADLPSFVPKSRPL